MKKTTVLSLILMAGVLLNACTEDLDPLAPGSMDGKYALPEKALVPIDVGNHWTYNVSAYDTSGVETARFQYTITVVDTVLADTSKIPISSANKNSLSRQALVWYLFQSDLGATTLWQVDTLEDLCIRSVDDTRFYEQINFNFRASVGDSTAPKATGADINIWGSVDTSVTDDSVYSTLVSKDGDTLRTTLGSAPYFQYRQLYAVRPYYTDYYFKPGFGLVLIERYERKADGAVVCIRRDQLVSYYFK